MTIKPEVLAAMGKLRSLSKRDGVSEANRECVEIIRAELLAMDARLAEADALLREVKEDGNLYLLPRIEAHLQGGITS